MNQRAKTKQLLGLTLMLGLFFVVSGCLKKVEVKPVVVEKKEEVKVEKKKDEAVGEKVDDENQEVDTSDWLIYRNEELGVEFKYPKEYNPFIEINKNNKSDNSVVSGVANIIYSENNLSFSFFTKDYKAFMDYPYIGNVDLGVWCKDKLEISTNYKGLTLGSLGFCDNIMINNQKSFYEIKLVYLPECSGANLIQNAYLNLKNNKYDGLIISKKINYLSEVLNKKFDCSDNTNLEIEKIAKDYLNNIINFNNLDINTIKELNEFKYVISGLILL